MTFTERRAKADAIVKQKDAATYAAQKADFAKVKPRVSAPVANNTKNSATTR